MKNKIIISIFIVVILSLISLSIYIGIRNSEVYEYRISLLDRTNWKQIYSQLPPYNDMLYSFKPLKDKYWINDSIINKNTLLLNNDNLIKVKDSIIDSQNHLISELKGIIKENHIVVDNEKYK